MTEVQASVTRLEQSPTKAGKARWSLDLSNGLKFITIWDAALADRVAKIPKGAEAVFTYEVQQNGQYTNHTLRNIAYSGPTVDSGPIPKASGGGGGMSDEDKKRVTFLSLFNSVANLYAGSASVEEAWASAVDLQCKLFPKPVEAPVVALVPAPVTLDDEIQSGAVQAADARPWD